jgi:toxin-antitoxin system PIN domain toxin
VKFFPDVNVIFPILLSRHEHRDAALQWFDTVAAGQFALCRLTRLGVLRLLTNAQVMGPDVLAPAHAFQALTVLETDERAVLLHEPDGLDAELKRLIARKVATPNLWSDAYLAAFARIAGLKLVSFDRGFRKFDGLDPVLLTGGRG